MKKETRRLLEKRRLSFVDIGCGKNKQVGWFGIDYRKLPGVDLVQDLEKFPWKVPSETFNSALASHVVEPHMRNVLTTRTTEKPRDDEITYTDVSDLILAPSGVSNDALAVLGDLNSEESPYLQPVRMGF